MKSNPIMENSIFILETCFQIKRINFLLSTFYPFPPSPVGDWSERYIFVGTSLKMRIDLTLCSGLNTNVGRPAWTHIISDMRRFKLLTSQSVYQLFFENTDTNTNENTKIGMNNHTVFRSSWTQSKDTSAQKNVKKCLLPVLY